MTSKRTFSSGANRNSAAGKLEYYGFNHPVLEQKFAEYMHKHRYLEDGTLRDSNNWWKGWDKIVSLQSLNRHLQDLNAIHAGYKVVKYKNGNEVTKYITMDLVDEIKYYQGFNPVEIVTEEDCCAAIRFNAMAYLLQTFNSSKENIKDNTVDIVDFDREVDYSTKKDI